MQNYNALSALKTALPNWKKLRVLNLKETGISRDACDDPLEMISEELKALKSLEILILDNNFLYVEGYGSLHEIIPSLPSLRVLGLAYTAPCFQDGREYPDDPFLDSLVYNSGVFLAFADTIANHSSLQNVDITHKKRQINNADLKSFLQRLKQQNPAIQVIAERE